MPKIPRSVTDVEPEELPEPLATQEAVGFSRPRRLRDAEYRKAVRRSAGNTPERAEYLRDR